MTDTTTSAVERMADDLSDNAEIDAAEGGNPDVVALEERAAATLRALAAERDRLNKAFLGASTQAGMLMYQESDRNRQASEDYLSLVAELDAAKSENIRLREALEKTRVGLQFMAAENDDAGLMAQKLLPRVTAALEEANA